MTKRYKCFQLLLVLGWLNCAAFAVDAEGKSDPIQDEKNDTSIIEKNEPIEPEILELEKGEVKSTVPRSDSVLPASIRLGTLFDVSFRGGGAVAQGFSIPVLRLSAMGELGSQVSYRVSVSQTKEISSALLPQLMPSEAYVDLLPSDSIVRFRAGMFMPRINPWWRADLSEVGWSDYHESHKALFLSREMGAEVQFRPFDDVVDLVLGYVNGSGVLAENTNNAHAITGSLTFNLDFSGAGIFFGAGGFTMSQSAQGAVNYKANWAADLFAGLKVKDHRFGVESFLGHYEDSTRSVSPSGGAGFVEVGLTPHFSLFGRYETLSVSPVTGSKSTQTQIGPIVKIYPQATLFGTYSELEGAGSTERITQLKLRVAM